MTDRNLSPRWILALAALAALGCSSESTDAGGANGGPARRPEASPPANAVGGFEAVIPTEELDVGEETYPCWVLPLDITGPSRFVNAAVMRAGSGLHHGNVTTRPKTDGEGVRPCGPSGSVIPGEAGDILAGGSVLFGSTTQLEGEEWRHFPDDMAYRVKDGFEIVARMHYMNTGTTPVSVDVSYEWFTIPEEDVSMEIGPLFWQITKFEIPERSTYTTGTECYFADPAMQIVEAMPHMHALGTHFQAWFIGGERDGERFIDQPGYEPDGAIRQFVPGVDIGQGQGLGFSCTWENPYDRVVADGGSGNDEMCMLFGYGYPAAKAYTLAAAPDGPCASIAPPDPTAP